MPETPVAVGPECGAARGVVAALVPAGRSRSRRTPKAYGAQDRATPAQGAQVRHLAAQGQASRAIPDGEPSVESSSRMVSAN